MLILVTKSKHTLDSTQIITSRIVSSKNEAISIMKSAYDKIGIVVDKYHIIDIDDDEIDWKDSEVDIEVIGESYMYNVNFRLNNTNYVLNVQAEDRVHAENIVKETYPNSDILSVYRS